MADHLSLAGINVRLDKWHNGLSTSIHTGFVTELESVDYIIVVGSKLYGDKCRQKKNNVVIAEARIIAERHKRQPGRILPVLLSDNPRDSFPAFLRDKVFANFNDPKNYPQQLSVIILATCKYADKYENLAQTLQNMIAGAERIQQLSAEGLNHFNP
ncbi:MAG: toll/interleukin-1 receptor domain-containing protein [Parachlamydiaceae bacterium]|nr:MAG: toll/interleukin-1 receptor domain-containing protein [Parachlamydiaceae bacterium]